MADGKVPEQPEKIDLKSQLEEARKRTEAAKDRIKSVYAALERKIRTSLADFNKSIVQSVLMMPLNSIQTEIDSGKALSNQALEKLEELRKRAEDFAISYIQTMAQEKGGIDTEVLSRMTSDANRKADRFANLLISGKYPDVVQAYLYAHGSQGKYGDKDEAGVEAMKTMKKHLNAEFHKPNSDVMSYVWSVLSFMSKEDRVKVAKDFCKNDAGKLGNFLNKGNVMGVYNAAEIQELNPAKKYTEKELEKFANNWKVQNDFKAEASRLGFMPYGSEVTIGKHFLRDIIFGFAKFSAGVTIVGNFVTGAWEGGKFKGLGGSFKRLTKPQPLAAAALYGAIKVGESDKTFDQLFHGDDAKKQAAIDLRKERDGNPKWQSWDGFFKQQDFAGAKVFFEFIQHAKKDHEKTDLDELANYMIPGNFQGFLERMADRKKTGKDDAKSLDYAALRDSFKKINPKEILHLAKIFDTLNLGGETAKGDYAQYMEIPDKSLDKKKSA